MTDSPLNYNVLSHHLEIETANITAAYQELIRQSTEERSELVKQIESINIRVSNLEKINPIYRGKA